MSVRSTKPRQLVQNLISKPYLSYILILDGEVNSNIYGAQTDGSQYQRNIFFLQFSDILLKVLNLPFSAKFFFLRFSCLLPPSSSSEKRNPSPSHDSLSISSPILCHHLLCLNVLRYYDLRPTTFDKCTPRWQYQWVKSGPATLAGVAPPLRGSLRRKVQNRLIS